MKKIIAGSILLLTLGACSTAMVPESIMSASSQERPEWVEPGVLRTHVTESPIGTYFEGGARGPHLEGLRFSACNQAIKAWKESGKDSSFLFLADGPGGVGVWESGLPGPISKTYWEKLQAGKPGEATERYNAYCYLPDKGGHS